MRARKTSAHSSEVRSAGISPWLKIGAMIRIMRLRQWSKNILMLAPLLFAHQLGDWTKLLSVFLGIFFFSLCASATYIWNDLSDLHNDRNHPEKKKRPIAAGVLKPWEVKVQSAVLMAAGLIGAFLLGKPSFLVLVLGYVAVTVLYSLYLKRILIVDVLVLSGLYTYRLFMGASIAAIALSPWLLGFSMFLFLSLAFIKRYSELSIIKGTNHRVMPGRGYESRDEPLIVALGSSAGLVAVLIFALYISSPAVAQLYRSPEFLWLVCPCLLYWICRMWFLAGRGFIHEDPVVFAISDARSALIGALCVLLIVLAITFELPDAVKKLVIMP